MSIAQNGSGKELYPVGTNVVSEDSSFVAGDSPAEVDVSSLLGTTGNRGYVKNDGAGDISLQVAHEGGNYGNAFTIKSGEAFDLTGLQVSKVKLTWVADSSYRVHVW